MNTETDDSYTLGDGLYQLWLVLLGAATLILLASIAMFAATAAYDFAKVTWCEYHPSVDADGYPVKCGGDGY